MSRVTIPILLSALALAACATSKPPPRVYITNAQRQPVTQVEMRAGGREPIRVARLEGQQSEYLEWIPSSLQLSWTDAQGRSHTQDANLEKKLPAGFNRNVYVQIEPDQKLRVMLGATTRRAESDIPWSRPESWEGAPSIPGLNAN